ncbi:MAG: HsdM family class I SAM-dependent methyltransferase [Candidatus Scalindua sp.]
MRISEFTSYVFIKSELSKLGWDTRNPARNTEGELYTQQECLDNPEIKKYLQRKRPEYVAKIREDRFYVFEAKPRIEDIDKAFNEAKDYAKKINKSQIIKASIISGVAGNDEDGYVVKSAFLENNKFKVIRYHNKELTSLVSRKLALEILELGKADIPELIIDEKHLIDVAESINEVLHAGSINKDERASVMASILLSMVGDSKPDHNASPTVFVKDINNRAENTLITHSKREFYSHIEIKLPSKKEAQQKYKKALVLTMFSLLKINIRAAMNSGSDVLGQFYEVFLKYGNVAKDIGIVLTPRHITRYIARIMDISHSDVIYDPTCGTGGFLVAAYDHVRANSSKAQLEEFKKHKIFGIEQQPKVAALAIVNMIFRGDGKNNIIDNDCLSQCLNDKVINGENSAEYAPKTKIKSKRSVTKVLMNPPFALKDKGEKEFKFLQHALEQMQDGGLLFSVLPLSVLLKGGYYKSWRKDYLIKKHSLLSVVTFPEDLFYPVGINACGIFIKKGHPHNKKQKVLWIRAMNDGYSKQKGKRLPDHRVRNDLDKIKMTLFTFLKNQSMRVKKIPQFIKACPINFDDKELELTPEIYLDSNIPSVDELKENMDTLLREYVAFMIRNRKEV